MDSFSDVYGKPWSEGEYIVALNAFSKHGEGPCHESAPFVQRLSRLLRRTPDSIVMRLANFDALRTAADAQPKGLMHVGPAGRKVFHEWHKEAGLEKCAAAFERQIEQERATSLFAPESVTPIFLGRYRIDEEWRRGGFATIYTCCRQEDGARCALKVLRTDTSIDEDSVARFRREIRLLKQVIHPNLIRIFEDNLDSSPTHPGYVMEFATYSLGEYIDGTAAKTNLFGTSVSRPALDGPTAAAVFQDVASAVSALHTHQPAILHRDINPNNVLWVEGRGWMLSDFGLAAFMSRSPATSTFKTNTGPGIGTGHYTAPEQWRDLRSASVCSDVYSLGVLLWELFSSETGFRTDHLGLASWVESVVRKAVSYKPEDRYQSVGELVIAFENARRGFLR